MSASTLYRLVIAFPLFAFSDVTAQGSVARRDMQMRPATDSIVLERTACFGMCPQYRLVLYSDGRVRWESHERGEIGRVEADSISPMGFQFILREAERSGFYGLPEVVARDPKLCPIGVSDMSTITVSIFAAVPKKVERYGGCGIRRPGEPFSQPIMNQRRIEDLIDSVAGSVRWVQWTSRAQRGRNQ